jgi:hypothetical protein
MQVLGDELAHLRRRAAGVERRVELGAQRVGGHSAERGVAAQAGKQVVGGAGRDRVGHRHAVPTDHLVQFLPIAARGHREHQPALGGHERHLPVHVPPHHRIAHLESRRHVGGEDQDGVHREERLGQREPAVGAVVERALQPLRGGRVRRARLQRDDEPRQAADALGAHRVPLVCHRARADLLRLERLEQFALVLQQAEVVAQLAGRLRNAAQRVDDEGVHLARVRLARHGVGAREAQLARHLPVELAHLLVVPPEELEERRLRARGALAAVEAQRLEHVAEALHVEREVLHPQRGALAHRGELRRLEVRVGEARRRRVARGEGLQRAQERDEPAQHEAEAVAHHQQVGVVGDEGAGGAEVDHLARRLGLVAEGVHVRHDVVAKAALVLRRDLEVGVVEVRAHGHQRRLGDVDAQLPLALGQGEPQAAPQADAVLLPPQRLHGGGGVPGAEGRAIAIVGHQK